MTQLIVVFDIPDNELFLPNCPCEVLANYESRAGVPTSITMDAAISMLVDAWLEANYPDRFTGLFGWDEILSILVEENVDAVEDRQVEHVFLEIESAFPVVDTILRSTLNPLKYYRRVNTRWIGRSCLLTMDTP